MQLEPVYECDCPKLSQNNLWATIRSKIVQLIDQRNIQLTSIDLVRFRWLETDLNYRVTKDDSGRIRQVYKEGVWRRQIFAGEKVVTTPVTIWVGVLPDTLTAEVAFKNSRDILDLLRKNDISNIDIAYREALVLVSKGPTLFSPVEKDDALRSVIDPVSTALSLPIAGMSTRDQQGTMGLYFRVGNDLYGVTARHVLFPSQFGNAPYTYVDGPKKEVVLMSLNGFENFQLSIKNQIARNTGGLPYLKNDLERLEAALRENPDDPEVKRGLTSCRYQLRKRETATKSLKEFFLQITKEWIGPQDRVIGHIVWAPPISYHTDPHGHTKDICVIKLDSDKFTPNFGGNLIDSAPVILPGQLFNAEIRPPEEFTYPNDRVKIQSILPAEDFKVPTNVDKQHNPVRHVIKHGYGSGMTFGRLNGFESHIRRHSDLGTRDSIEAAFFSLDDETRSFSKAGDSGSIVVDSTGNAVALITADSGHLTNRAAEITYGTPMYWLWDAIKAQFPGASLCFDD